MESRGLRVAVTRDESAEGPLTQALRRRGLVAVACPVLVTLLPFDRGPLVRAARSLERYDWVVVASARAVAALVRARGGPLPGRVRTAAVGAKTAEALVAHGAEVPLVAPVAGAGPLAAILRDADRWRGRRVLVPRAAEGLPVLGDALRDLGADVDEVVAYRTVARPPEAILSAWQAARPDAVVVASPSAAHALARALGVTALRELVRVVAIGSTTATVLAGLGIPVVVPERADFESAADLLDRGVSGRAVEV